MAEKIIQTSNNIKQDYRDYLRKYFRSQYSFGMQYIKDVVLMLINFPEINSLKKKLGDEEYSKTLTALSQYDNHYSYANLINDNIIKMQEKHESDLFKKKIEIQNIELMKIAVGLPPINFRIMRAFFLLVNNCDLKNISVPREERFDKRKGLPSYLVEEKGSF